MNRSAQESRTNDTGATSSRSIQEQMDSPSMQAITGNLPADRNVASQPATGASMTVALLDRKSSAAHAAPRSADRTEAEKGRTPAAQMAASFAAFTSDLGKKVDQSTFPKEAGRNGEVCTAVEFPGMGPALSAFLPHESEQAKKLFESAKKSLVQWAAKNKQSLPPETLAWMKEQVSKLTLSTRTMEEEPDLAWRGIGVLSHDMRGNGVVQLGGGFARLVKENPERARFELTRLLAQSWAPCQFKAANIAQPWGEYLGCMKIGETLGCESEQYSEAGWAVSSAVALKLANPGCELGAFREQDNARCVSALLAPTKPAPKTDTRTAALKRGE